MKKIAQEVKDKLQYSTDKGWHLKEEGPQCRRHATEGGRSRHTVDGEMVMGDTPFYRDGEITWRCHS